MNEKLHITRKDYESLIGFPNSSIGTEEDRNIFKSLEEKLNNAVVVEPENMLEHTVTLNSTVSFKFERYQEILTYTLVYPKDADISQKKISILTPVGIALLGHKEGDIFEARVPSGLEKIIIEKVECRTEKEEP